MDAAEKVLERMRQSQSGYKLRDFDTLLLGFGFTYKDGPHRLYTHERYRYIKVGVPRHNIKGVYAKLAVQAVDRVRELKEQDEHKSK